MKPLPNIYETNLSLPVVWKWGKRVGFSILDQGLFSGTNFLLNILIARWLTPEEYGAFSIAFVTFLFCSGFHNALILEPMSIFGPLKPDLTQRKYIISLFWMQLFLSVFLGFLINISGLIFSYPLKQALIGIGFITPLMLSVWFFRNSFYIKTEPHKAAFISGLYSVSLIGILIWVDIMNKITLSNVFWIIGVACVPPIVAGFIIHNKILGESYQDINYGQMIKENWEYGKWIVLTAFSNGITALSFVPLIGFIIGLREAAAFKGWQNLINPMQQVLTAGALLLVPKLSSNNLHSNETSFVKKILWISLFLTSIYVLLYLIFSKEIIALLYQQDFYMTYSWLGFAFALYLLIMAGNTTILIFLRAEKQSKGVFLGKLYSALALIISIPFLIWSKSMQVMMAVYISIAILETIVLFMSMKRKKSVDYENLIF